MNNRATIETYQDEQRAKVATSRLDEVNYASYAEKLLEEAESYTGGMVRWLKKSSKDVNNT